MKDVEELVSIAIDRGYRIHRDLGPGLLESAYEVLLFESLRRDGLRITRQQPVAIEHDGIVIADAFRYDLLVEDKLLIEVKSVERNAAVHAKQVITYLRLLKLEVGLLMNFGCATFKEGLSRLVNNYGGRPR